MQGAAPKFFCCFLNNHLEFFYRFIYWNVLRLTAKSNVILLKNDIVIDFLTWPLTNFSVLKSAQAKNAV